MLVCLVDDPDQHMNLCFVVLGIAFTVMCWHLSLTSEQTCAGVVVKHVLDGSTVSALTPGQNPVAAAQEAHLNFASYLASHSLSMDVWDGDSLLQVCVSARV